MDRKSTPHPLVILIFLILAFLYYRDITREKPKRPKPCPTMDYNYENPDKFDNDVGVVVV